VLHIEKRISLYILCCVVAVEAREKHESNKTPVLGAPGVGADKKIEYKTNCLMFISHQLSFFLVGWDKRK
jgi:hypothetical protein